MKSTAITVKDLENIREEGLKALRTNLGAVGMIKFIQMYSNGEGDYTNERDVYLKDVTIEDFDNFMVYSKE